MYRNGFVTSPVFNQRKPCYFVYTWLAIFWRQLKRSGSYDTGKTQRFSYLKYSGNSTLIQSQEFSRAQVTLLHVFGTQCTNETLKNVCVMLTSQPDRQLIGALLRDDKTITHIIMSARYYVVNTHICWTKSITTWFKLINNVTV